MTDDAPRTILITGVSRGLGEALGRWFLERGHTIIGCARSDAAIAAWSRRAGANHHFHQVDVADDAQVAAWAADVRAVPDLLLNNAALINANSELWRVDPDEFSRVVDVNIKGVFHVIRHFVPRMIRRGRGVIVNFSSTWGRSTSPEVAPYCATKYAIEGLTSALAAELPPGLAAIALNPGVINTDMLRSCFAEGARGYPQPDAWAAKAAPFLLELGEADNGDALTAPAP